MNTRHLQLLARLSTALETGDTATLTQLRTELDPDARETMLGAILGELADRTITEFQGHPPAAPDEGR
jgi:hypothetical protein